MARREMRGDENGQMAGLTGGRACDEGGSTKQDGPEALESDLGQYSRILYSPTLTPLAEICVGEV
jgi:hypothetical protein